MAFCGPRREDNWQKKKGRRKKKKGKIVRMKTEKMGHLRRGPDLPDRIFRYMKSLDAGESAIFRRGETVIFSFSSPPSSLDLSIVTGGGKVESYWYAFSLQFRSFAAVVFSVLFFFLVLVFASSATARRDAQVPRHPSAITSFLPRRRIRERQVRLDA